VTKPVEFFCDNVNSFFLTFYLCFPPTNLAKAAAQYFIYSS